VLGRLLRDRDPVGRGDIAALNLFMSSHVCIV
jgi:hypothetical protein